VLLTPEASTAGASRIREIVSPQAGTTQYIRSVVTCNIRGRGTPADLGASLHSTFSIGHSSAQAGRAFQHVPGDLPEERQLKLLAVQRTGEESKALHSTFSIRHSTFRLALYPERGVQRFEIRFSNFEILICPLRV
jgi:hypothetical protein